MDGAISEAVRAVPMPAAYYRRPVAAFRSLEVLLPQLAAGGIFISRKHPSADREVLDRLYKEFERRILEEGKHGTNPDAGVGVCPSCGRGYARTLGHRGCPGFVACGVAPGNTRSGGDIPGTAVAAEQDAARAAVDERVASALRAGDIGPIAAHYYNRIQATAEATCLRNGLSDPDATVAGHEIAGDVFEAVKVAKCPFEGRSARYTWLVGITKNKCKDFMRARKRRNGRFDFVSLDSAHGPAQGDQDVLLSAATADTNEVHGSTSISRDICEVIAEAEEIAEYERLRGDKQKRRTEIEQLTPEAADLPLARRIALVMDADGASDDEILEALKSEGFDVKPSTIRQRLRRDRPLAPSFRGLWRAGTRTKRPTNLNRQNRLRGFWSAAERTKTPSGWHVYAASDLTEFCFHIENVDGLDVDGLVVTATGQPAPAKLVWSVTAHAPPQHPAQCRMDANNRITSDLAPDGVKRISVFFRKRRYLVETRNQFEIRARQDAAHGERLMDEMSRGIVDDGSGWYGTEW